VLSCSNEEPVSFEPREIPDVDLGHTLLCHRPLQGCLFFSCRMPLPADHWLFVSIFVNSDQSLYIHHVWNSFLLCSYGIRVRRAPQVWPRGGGWVGILFSTRSSIQLYSRMASSSCSVELPPISRAKKKEDIASSFNHMHSSNRPYTP